ncbi:hypothetical protein ALC57_14411 [Trachymyrmex cornetzi]|uniref:Uncharacterized protein n=1 Tax=Trachymyrmex cornetzi TaxID=471704 RepID=A0A195DKJ1_9HYME|nr:hypothetical protein ALC57_14411 [Trachymyrmex cornetzi]
MGVKCDKSFIIVLDLARAIYDASVIGNYSLSVANVEPGEATRKSGNDVTNAVTPLTEEQIMSTIHHVLLVLIKKDVDKNNPLQVCNNASAAATLKTSAVQMKQEPNIEDMRRPQDVRSVTTDEESSFSDISLKDIKKERENSFVILEKNVNFFISRSNPAIYVNNNISRSDTFIREEHSKKTNDEDVFKDFTDAERFGETDSSSDLCQLSLNEVRNSDISSDLFHISLKEIRKSVMNIMTKLNHLEARIEQIGEEPFKIRIQPQSRLRGIGGSWAIIDITCHVNIGYRRLPNLSAEKEARAKGIAERNRR